MKALLKNATLVEKAWVVNPDNFKEPHYAPTDVYYAQTSGKAKHKILSQIYYDEFKDCDGKEIGFVNLKIKRSQSADKLLIDGIIKTFWQIEYEQKKRQYNERIDKLVSDNPTAMAYILKGGCYYGSDFCGYTERLINAGIYKIHDAAKHVKSCSLGDYMRLIVINTEEHNKMINDKIADLKTRIIL